MPRSRPCSSVSEGRCATGEGAEEDASGQSWVRDVNFDAGNVQLVVARLLEELDRERHALCREIKRDVEWFVGNEVDERGERMGVTDDAAVDFGRGG